MVNIQSLGIQKPDAGLETLLKLLERKGAVIDVTPDRGLVYVGVSGVRDVLGLDDSFVNDEESISRSNLSFALYDGQLQAARYSEFSVDPTYLFADPNTLIRAQRSYADSIDIITYFGADSVTQYILDTIGWTHVSISPDAEMLNLMHAKSGKPLINLITDKNHPKLPRTMAAYPEVVNYSDRDFGAIPSGTSFHGTIDGTTFGVFLDYKTKYGMAQGHSYFPKQGSTAYDIRTEDDRTFFTLTRPDRIEELSVPSQIPAEKFDELVVKAGSPTGWIDINRQGLFTYSVRPLEYKEPTFGLPPSK